jgi:hypothetical protein
VFLVLGVDAATWTIVRPNLGRLPNFARLMRMGRPQDLLITEKPVSPLVWCGMFCGKTFEEHHHDSFVRGGNILRREDIQVDFVWDTLSRAGKKAIALNVPFVVPPYSFGVSFRPVGFGLPTNEKEWQEELDRVTEETLRLMAQKPDLLVSVYTLLDRVQHFHWGEPVVVNWYERLDQRLGQLLLDTGFLNDARNRLILISDHGFCGFGEAKVQTLPLETREGRLKGDHHESALLVTANVDHEIRQPQDVCHAITRALLPQ